MIWIIVLAGIVTMVGTLILVVEFLIPQMVIALGKVDAWWSPFRTLPPPGEMYIMVRGAPNGPFDTVLESVLDHDYNHRTHEFVGPDNYPQSDNYLSKLGVAWVGFFRYLFYREVKYDKWEMKSDGTWGLVAKIRNGPSIYFRYYMAVEIKAAETVGNFPVDAVVTLTVEIRNPAKAFFFAGGWEAQVAAAVAGRIRRYVSDKTIEHLREEHKHGDTLLVDEIKALPGRTSQGTGPHNPAGLYALFGIDIPDARFVLFDLVSGDEAMTDAVRALEIARLEADANKERGRGERDLRTERAAGVREEVAAWGSSPVGGTIAMAEAIKVAKPNVLGGNIIASVEAGRRKEGEE